ncbi:MAG: N-acetylmuramoyl-L-alanine amidase [Verrucomicrobiota bacterium]
MSLRLLLLLPCLIVVIWTPTVAESGPLEGLTIAVDVGHSTARPGAFSARGRGEFEFNLDAARVIDEILERAGATCLIINETGTLTGLAERPERALRLGADDFISIHHDSVNQKYKKTWTPPGQNTVREYSDKFRGYSVFCSEKNPMAEESRAIALMVGAAMRKAGFKPTLHHAEPIPGENRPLIDRKTGVYEFTDLVVTKAAALPSILLECGVIAHRDEELDVSKRSYQERVGNALLAALVAARSAGVLP